LALSSVSIRITVIHVTPSEGYYWTTKHGKATAGAKMLIGAAIGKTLDDCRAFDGCGIFRVVPI